MEMNLEAPSQSSSEVPAQSSTVQPVQAQSSLTAGMIENKAFDQVLSVKINDQDTEIVFNKFTNKYFLIITQYQMMANLFIVKIDNQQNAIPGLGAVEQFSLYLTITPKFGQDTDELRSGITFLVNNSNLKYCPTEIVISLGLKEINGKILRQICDVLNEFLPGSK